MKAKDYALVGGMDWGYIDPFCFNLAQVVKVEFEDKFFYRTKTFLEVYGTAKDPRDWAMEIKKRLKFFGLTLSDISWIKADTQIFNRPIDSMSKSIAGL